MISTNIYYARSHLKYTSNIHLLPLISMMGEMWSFLIYTSIGFIIIITEQLHKKLENKILK